jgi:hypothetical protein
MKILYILLSVLSASLVILFSIISPTSPNILLFLAIFVEVYLLLIVVSQIIIKVSHSNISKNRALFLSIMFAACPVMLVAIESLSGINWLDLFLVIGIPGLISWYGIRSGLFQ